MNRPIDPAVLLARIDPICERFESELEDRSSRERPRLEDFLEGAEGEFREALFEELLALEVHHASVRGEAPDESDYLARFPDFESVIRRALGAAGGHSGQTMPGLLPGTKFGHYVIKCEIGRGGMGVVYEARHDTLERDVALKVLPDEFHAHPQARTRFAREARAIARLHHSSIVPVFEFGAAPGAHFFAMQLIEGESLAGQIERRRELSRGLDASEIRLVCRQIADVARALEFAHQSGIVHRDVKPSNVLLDARNKAWLVDFGVARLDESDLTTAEDLLGTIRYMPPERFSGVGGASGDIYSLGITLFEGLSLRTAFREKSAAELMREVIESELPPLREVVPGASIDLETVVARATDHDPRRRYPTAAAFAEDLERHLAGQPVLARRQGAVEKVVRWIRRNRGPTAVIGLLAVLAAGAAVVASTLETKNRDILRLSDDVNGLLAESMEAQEGLRKELYRADMVLCAHEASRRRGASLTTILNRWLPTPGHSGDRGWEWWVLRSMLAWDADRLWFRRAASKCVDVCDVTGQVAVGGRSGVTILDGKTRVVSMQIMEFAHPGTLRFDPTGERILVSDIHRVSIYSTVTGERLASRDSPGYYPADWHPDGRRVLLLEPVPRLWDFQADTLEPVAGVESADRGLHISRDGNRMAVFTGAGVIRVLEPESGGLIREIDTALGGRERGVRLVRISPDGKRLACLTKPGGFRVYRVDDGSEIAAVDQAHVSHISSIRWSADADWLVTSSVDSMVKVWDAQTGQLVRELRGHQGQVRDACFMQNASMVVSTSELGDLRFWDLEDPPGHIFWSSAVSSSRRKGMWVEWTAVEERVRVHSEREVAEWDVTGRSMRRVNHGEGEGRFVSPGGRHALVTTPTSFSLMDLETGVDLLEGRFDAGEVLLALHLMGHAVRWSPDGRRLYVTGWQHAWIFDELHTGVRIRPMLESGQACASFDISPDGEKLVIAVSDGLLVLDAATAEVVRKVELPDRGFIDVYNASLDFEPSGERLAVAHRSRLMILDGFDYSLLANFEGDADEHLRCRWSPDGTRIATFTLEATVQLFDPEDGLVVSFACDEVAVDLAWDAAGRRLVALDQKGGCHLWNATTALEHEE